MTLVWLRRRKGFSFEGFVHDVASQANLQQQRTTSAEGDVVSLRLLPQALGLSEAGGRVSGRTLWSLRRGRRGGVLVDALVGMEAAG